MNFEEKLLLLKITISLNNGGSTITHQRILI